MTIFFHYGVAYVTISGSFYIKQAPDIMDGRQTNFSC